MDRDRITQAALRAELALIRPITGLLPELANIIAAYAEHEFHRIWMYVECDEKDAPATGSALWHVRRSAMDWHEHGELQYVWLAADDVASKLSITLELAPTILTNPEDRERCTRTLAECINNLHKLLQECEAHGWLISKRTEEPP